MAKKNGNNDQNVDKRIVELKKEGKTVKEIAEILNDEGVKPARAKQVNLAFVNYRLNKLKNGKKAAGSVRRTKKIQKSTQRNDDVPFLATILNSQDMDSDQKVHVLKSYYNI